MQAGLLSLALGLPFERGRASVRSKLPELAVPLIGLDAVCQ
jgi:hypothetical protein